jgi:hypothetical protein
MSIFAMEKGMQGYVKKGLYGLAWLFSQLCKALMGISLAVLLLSRTKAGGVVLMVVFFMILGFSGR